MNILKSAMSFIGDHRLNTLLITGLIVTGYGFIQQVEANERRRIFAEQAEERLANQRVVLDSVIAAREISDSIAAEARAEVEAVRAESQRNLARAEALVGPAEAVVTTAGRNVDATLDSLRVAVIPANLPVVTQLGLQIDDERNAFRNLREIDLERIQTQEEIIAAQDSIANIRMVEYRGLWMEYDATRMTLEQAEEALRAQTGYTEGSWYDAPLNVLKGVALIGTGYALHEFLVD